MKYLFSVILAVFLISTVACQSKVEKKDLKTFKDSVSYAIGYDIGSNFRNQEIDVELDMVKKGIERGLTDTSAALLFLQKKNYNKYLAFYNKK
jgi:FKBP-type peptidyl-prolyl cis-trans isomerase FklB